MHSKSKIVLALVAGVALGAAAVQGLHAQAKPPVYAVAEITVTNLDAYVKEYAPLAHRKLPTCLQPLLVRNGLSSLVL